MAFAGVLAMRPSVLVLDEPVAGLDPASREDFLTLIEKFHRSGLTIVMVSHNMNDISRLADRVLVMNKGEIAWLPRKCLAMLRNFVKLGSAFLIQYVSPTSCVILVSIWKRNSIFPIR